MFLKTLYGKEMKMMVIALYVVQQKTTFFVSILLLELFLLKQMLIFVEKLCKNVFALFLACFFRPFELFIYDKLRNKHCI